MTQLAMPFTGAPELTCPCCGHEEPTALLASRHHPTGADLCHAMGFARNHVLSGMRNLHGGEWCCARHGTFRQDCAEAWLRRHIEHAAEVWGPRFSEVMPWVEARLG